MNEICIFTVNVCYGQYVFCATSWKQLYSFIRADRRMCCEVLGVGSGDDYRIMGFHEFTAKCANKTIKKTPLHLGYLGGFQE